MMMMTMTMKTMWFLCIEFFMAVRHAASDHSPVSLTSLVAALSAQPTRRLVDRIFCQPPHHVSTGLAFLRLSCFEKIGLTDGWAEALNAAPMRGLLNNPNYRQHL